MKIAIIGGGAAGFFSAIAVKENFPQASVTIFEKSKGKETATYDEIIDKYELPYVVWNHGSICHLETSAVRRCGRLAATRW